MGAAAARSAAPGRSGHADGGSRQRSHDPVDRSFAGSGAAARAWSEGEARCARHAAHVRRLGADGGRLLRHSAARRGNFVSEERIRVSDLIGPARAAMQHAWAPYSNFHVGAAIEASDGKVYVGCNVESASYGLTICAERMALGAAVVGGARKLKRIVVTTEGDPPAAPCGARRQLLAEFGLGPGVIAGGPGPGQGRTPAALLPDAFTKETLDR